MYGTDYFDRCYDGGKIICKPLEHGFLWSSSVKGWWTSRGGSWNDLYRTDSAYSSNSEPNSNNNEHGFRLAQD